MKIYSLFLMTDESPMRTIHFRDYRRCLLVAHGTTSGDWGQPVVTEIFLNVSLA